MTILQRYKHDTCDPIRFRTKRIIGIALRSLQNAPIRYSNEALNFPGKSIVRVSRRLLRRGAYSPPRRRRQTLKAYRHYRWVALYGLHCLRLVGTSLLQRSQDGSADTCAACLRLATLLLALPTLSFGGKLRVPCNGTPESVVSSDYMNHPRRGGGTQLSEFIHSADCCDNRAHP